MEWFKSSYSSAVGNCVEVAWHTSSHSARQDCVEVGVYPNKVLVRDSKDKSEQPRTLEFGLREWENILDSVHEGTFNWFHFLPLVFTAGEKKAFILGVLDREFDLPQKEAV